MKWGPAVALFGIAIAWTIMLLFGGLDLDRALLTILYAGDRPDYAAAARIVTELGGWRVLVPLTAAGALWLLLARRFRDAALLLLITLGGRALVELQKEQMGRLRPEDQEHLVAVQSFAFPSAHAANMTMVGLSLALLLVRTFPQRAVALWCAVWLALIVGTSRVVLGVHWPSDVIAGWAFGLFWTLLLLGLAGIDLTDGTPRRLRHSSPEGETR
jgi:undecaprenyl-diphosphatase